MNDKKKACLIKYTAYTLVLLALYLLQTTPGLFEILGIKPQLVIPAAVAVALYDGEFSGGLYGALAGALCDLGEAVLFGFNAIILLVCCTVVGLLAIYMLRRSAPNYVLLLGGVLAVRMLLDYLLNYAMWGYEQVWMVLAYQMLPTAIYSAAVSPLIYYLFGWMHGKFEQRLNA